MSNKDFTNFLKNKSSTEANIFINIGFIPYNSIYSIYDQIDFLLFPSILESYGLPLLESMYYKTPILCSNLDFARDICGNLAVYFNPFDSFDLYNKMNYLINEKTKIKKIFAENSFKLLPKYSWIDFFNLVDNII